MNIDELLIIQDQQNKFWYDRNKLTPEEINHILYEHLLGVNLNSCKILGSVDWQRTSLTRKIVNICELKENLVDILKHLFSIMLLYGIDAEIINSVFLKKTKSVDLKLNELKIDIALIKLISIDLDGVVADFYGGFTKYILSKGYFIKNKFHDTYDMQTLFNEQIDPKEIGELMYDFMYKDEGFLNLDVIDDSIVIINKLIDDGYGIIFLTGRDNKYNIITDTISWLNKIGILDYKKVIFNSNKVEAINSLKPINIAYHIEDRDKHAVEVSSTKTKVLLLRKEYNKTIENSEFIEIVNDWNEIYSVINKGHDYENV